MEVLMKNVAVKFLTPVSEMDSILISFHSLASSGFWLFIILARCLGAAGSPPLLLNFSSVSTKIYVKMRKIQNNAITTATSSFTLPIPRLLGKRWIIKVETPAEGNQQNTENVAL